MTTRCLGKKHAKLDSRTLKAAKYMSSMPGYHAAPPWRDWTDKAAPNWGMMLNNSLGDCTVAATGHLVQTWTSEHGSELTIPDSAILKAYEDVGNYKPGDPSTDNGAQMLDVLNYWRNTGIGGHKINSFVQIDYHNLDEVKAAINLFGAIYVGVMLPTSAQKQTTWTGSTDRPLTGDNSPNSWGGHAIMAATYDRSTITFITWGTKQRADWQWWADYVDECYAVISNEWVTANMAAPNGFDLAALVADLSTLQV